MFDFDGLSTPYFSKFVCFILLIISLFANGFSTPYFSKFVFFIFSLAISDDRK
jgi:hypothetical protein